MTISIPRINNWEIFESFCLDVYKNEWKDINAQKNGRSGQAQAGVDIFGSENNTGVQCKKKDVSADNQLTITEIEDEVEKAKNFKPPLKKFIIAYTGQKDVKLQKKAREITDDNKLRGLFSVHVVSWADLEEIVLKDYPKLLETYYPAIYKVFNGDLKKEGDLNIITNIISESRKINLDSTVAKMTGLNNSAYMFCPKAELPNFISFKDWIDANRSFESDFDSIAIFDLYEAFITAFNTIYEFHYEYRVIKADAHKDNYVLGYATNPKWAKHGDMGAYQEKLRKAEKLGNDFDKTLDALKTKWRELKNLSK